MHDNFMFLQKCGDNLNSQGPGGNIRNIRRTDEGKLTRSWARSWGKKLTVWSRKLFCGAAL